MTRSETLFQQFGLKFTLTLALLGATALLIVGLLMGVYNERLYRAQKAREVAVQAQILGASVGAALVFEDRTVAQEYIDALRLNPEVEAASVYDVSGRRLAAYARAGAAPAPLKPISPAAGASRRLAVFVPALQDNLTVGTVYLRTLVEPLPRRLARYAGVAVLILMAAMLLGVLGVGHALLGRANAKLGERAQALADANNALQIHIQERDRAEAALLQAQKMEAIGKLTGGIAHDFNNLLMVASGGLDILERTEDQTKRARFSAAVRQALDRGAELTSKLLAFSRRSPLKPESVDLLDRIPDLTVLLERSLREDIVVDLRLAPDLWPVEVDPAQLEVALLNIAVNARDAMVKGGTLTIAGENLTAFTDGELNGNFVRLDVIDEGAGMSAEQVARAFEPFFTTKEVGRGTGLGLSQVYGFVRASGGDVRLRSTPEEGTTVSLYLPRSDRAPVTARVSSTAATGPAAPGRVLLVEDDDQVAEVVIEMLHRLSYNPTRVASAKAALALLARDRAFDLLFSDMVMPGGMGGMDLARVVSQSCPDLPIVLTTGFSEAATSAARAGFRVLPKPYSIDALASELGAARAA
jgi:signal transduction histidine kinase